MELFSQGALEYGEVVYDGSQSQCRPRQGHDIATWFKKNSATTTTSQKLPKTHSLDVVSRKCKEIEIAKKKKAEEEELRLAAAQLGTVGEAVGSSNNDGEKSADSERRWRS